MAAEYTPLVAVWEITMNCNMRCKHCGSSCSGPVPGELSTQEALQLADDLAAMGLQHITLSGGEPTTRPDWPLIAERFISQGVSVAIITNGWLLDRTIMETAARVGICTFAISIDGLPHTHDYIRKPGSFDRIRSAVALSKEYDIPITAVTCLHGKNLPELQEMKKLFVEMGIQGWQMQAANATGNMLDHLDWIIEPSDLTKIIDFAYDAKLEGALQIWLADSIGYYSMKDIQLRHEGGVGSEAILGAWKGCGAGKQVLGVRCNGDIIGCLSLRNDDYIEGNIRQTPLKEIWNRPGAFAWNRDLTKAQLTGKCGTCQFGARCLAGCASIKITRYKCTTENPLCAYHHAMERQEADFQTWPAEKLTEQAQEAIDEGFYQTAELALNRALACAPQDIQILNQLGFVHYKLENHKLCQDYNARALALDPTDAYAHKGMGLCLVQLGHIEEGIQHLRKSVELAPPGFTDPCHDLALVLDQQGRGEEAQSIRAAMARA